MRFLRWLARPNRNMIDMFAVSIGVSMLYEYGWQVWWKAMIVLFIISIISVKMEKFCGFR